MKFPLLTQVWSIALCFFCSNIQAQTIKNPCGENVPTVEIEKAGQPCGDSYTTLNAIGKPSGGTYLWSNGSTNPVLPIANNTVLTNITYTVVYSLISRPCKDTASIVLTPYTCAKIVMGGYIGNDTTVCGKTSYDPPKIISKAKPTGGGGMITYFWIYSCKDPNDPTFNEGLDVKFIDNTNMDCYDPPAITKTTWYRRCALGKGCCSADPGESNWVKIELKGDCCVQVTDPGEIGESEERCFQEYKPLKIVSKKDASGGQGKLEYLWLSTTDFDVVGDPKNFHIIPNAIEACYDPAVIAKTTWYRRCVRRAGCENYEEVLWVKKGIIKNVTDAGAICCNETTCATEFKPKPLKNVRSASGGSGTVQYIWLKSDYNNTAGDPTFTQIANSDSLEYSPSVITKSTYYRRCARTKSTASAEFQCPYIETTPMKKTLNGAVTFENVAANVNLSCSKPNSEIVTPTLKGYIGTLPTLTLTEKIIPGTCPDNFTICRTWTTSDNCGNTISAVQKIIKEDKLKPVFTWTAKDLTVNCGDSPPILTPMAMDNCDPQVQIQYSEKLLNVVGATNSKILRMWTATDNCSNTMTVTQAISFQTNPNFKMTVNSPVCADASLSLVAQGCASCTYLWSGPNGFTSKSKNPTLSNVNPTQSGTYVLKMTDASACNATFTKEILINPKPICSIVTTPIICSGETLKLNTGNYSAYNWQGPSFTATVKSPNILNSTTANMGTYKLTVTDANGCKANTSTYISVKASPICEITAENTSVCVSKPINLSVNSGTNIANWSGPNMFTYTGKSFLISVSTLAMSGEYKVIVTGANSCQTTKKINVEVKSCIKTSGLVVANHAIDAANTELQDADYESITNVENAIYPNPVENKLMLRYQNDQTQLRNLFISDTNGNVVFSETLNMGENENLISIDVSMLPSGIYNLKIGKENFRFVKQQ